jgi:glycerol-3-phosphate cytidylyltransferase
MNIGYTTMTGDLLHEGHIQFLQSASSLCDHLIVGVTTDELAQKQKRSTWFTFEQRRAVISAIGCVDTVIEHHGQTKVEAYETLNFTSLFIGDDYVGSHEYTSFKQEYPQVNIFYLPRTTGVSTTNIINKFEKRISDNLNVMAHGIGGPLIRLTCDKDQVVIKPILLGFREHNALNGSDSYEISDNLPRNWKTGPVVENKFPMISGVNGHREMKVYKYISHIPWIPFIDVRLVHTDSTPTIANSEMDNISAMQYERTKPTCTYWLYQKYSGDTLSAYMKKIQKTETHHECQQKFLSICTKIRKQIDTLNNIGVIHGDLHPENICVDIDTDVVSFIDFGWCLCDEFEMKRKEREYLEKCLLSDFDWVHFADSLHSYELDMYVQGFDFNSYVNQTFSCV